MIKVMSRPDVFPLRFKNPATKEALRYVAEQNGMSMTELAEKAIEHEIALMGADLERRLTEALEQVRSYRPATDLDRYIEAVAAGEESGLDPDRQVRAAHGPAFAAALGSRVEVDDKFGIGALFVRPAARA